MNQKKSITLTTTFVGLVCGFVLTQQQAGAAVTNAPDSTSTSMVASDSTAAATSAEHAESTLNEQPVNQQTSTQKSVTSTDTVSGTVNQNRISGTKSTVSPATNTSTQSASSSNNPTTSATTQQAAASSVSKANETTQPVSQPTVSAALQATKVTDSTNTASTTTDPQVTTITQGTWGTSKWEYTHQGEDYILHFHAGTLGASSHAHIYDTYYPNYHELGSIGASPEIFNCDSLWNDELTQIIIDPGVKANQDSSYLFQGLGHLQQIVGLANLDTADVIDMSHMFENYQGASLDFSQFDTSNVTNMSYMFEDYLGASLDLSHFNTANVTDMSQMFGGCLKLASLDVSKFDTANVTDMGAMFLDCYNLTSLNISNFNTSNVFDMAVMFDGCEKLTSLDLSNFNTAKVNSMTDMFHDCYSLNDLNVSNFKFNYTDLTDMFGYCTNLTSLDLSKWDTTGLDINHLMGMFFRCYSLNHLILGPKMVTSNIMELPSEYLKLGVKIPGTNRVVASPYWVATSGYQQGHKYTSDELMNLTGRDQVTTYDWDSTPAFTQTTETQTKVRTINIYRPNGQVKTYLQTAVISRPVTINADGSKTYGNWSTDQWEGYAVPELQGYTASQTQVAAQSVDPNTTDQTIDIFYAPQEQTVEVQYLANGQIVGTQKFTGYTGDTIMPNYHAPQGYEITSATPATITIDSSGKQIVQVQVSPKLYYSNEHKIITRVINVHFPSGRIQTYEQTALLERPVTINAVTGAKTYGSWNTGNWNALDVPVLDGYTASQDQVAAQQVTDQDSDQTVDVYYTPTN